MVAPALVAVGGARQNLSLIVSFAAGGAGADGKDVGDGHLAGRKAPLALGVPLPRLLAQQRGERGQEGLGAAVVLECLLEGCPLSVDVCFRASIFPFSEGRTITISVSTASKLSS